jgi:hypothetical protein
MKYLLMIFDNEAAWEALSPADAGQIVAAYGAYTEAMRTAGVLEGAARLQPSSTATLVRLRASKREVVNGPYAETREQLAGYYLIEVPDLDAALSWAARCPSASQGTIEVRPLWAM